MFRRISSDNKYRTRYIFKLRDKDRTETKWGRGPNEDEMGDFEHKEPILRQGQDENGIKYIQTVDLRLYFNIILNFYISPRTIIVY